MWYGSFEDVRAEAAPDGFAVDCDAGFAPPNAKLLFGSGNIGLPGDVDKTAIHGKRSVLDRIGRKLVEGHGEGLRLLRRNQGNRPALT
jgi:hypothetical protein